MIYRVMLRCLFLGGLVIDVIGCATLPYSSEQYVVTNKKIHMDITSTPSGLPIVGLTETGWLSPEEPERIGETPIHADVTVPDQITSINVDTGDHARYKVEPANVEVNSDTDSINVNFKVTDLLPQARTDFRTLSNDARISLISVIGKFSVAIESPKFLLGMKAAEAQSSLTEFQARFPSVKKTPQLGNMLHTMSLLMQVSAGLEMDVGVSDYVNFMEKVVQE